MFVIDLRMFVTHECSRFTNVRDSRKTGRSLTAWCVKPLSISVDFAAFMFRVVLCPANTCSTFSLSLSSAVSLSLVAD